MIKKWADCKKTTQADIRRRFVNWNYDKTVKTFEEWAAKHAFHVKQNGSLDNRHRYAEPDYMAD